MTHLFERPMARLAAVLAAAGVVVGLCIFFVAAFLRSSVPTVDFTSESGPVDLTIQTVGAIGFGPHPTWVSYLVRNPAGSWVHSTLWQLPSDRRINVTVYEYDSGGALRNSVWGGVTGTIGGTASLDGKPESVFNPAAGNGIAHSFNVPDLGINVPFYGVSATPKVPCAEAPCTLADTHNTITFSFMTPKGSGDYRWQCFVPCGLSYLYGNGGPMSSIGFMGGFLKVVS